jgi:hypothetical protein
MATTTVPSKKRTGKKKRSGHPATTQSKKPSNRAAFLQPVARILWPDTRKGRRTLIGILVAAFLLRAFRLMDLFPILVDESIYLHWAEIIEHQGQWFISLWDGKQPLQYWVLAVVRMVFGGDPLLEGRFVAVFVGLLSTIGVFGVGKRLGGDLVGLISAGLYAIFPLALLYDRLAYTESFVNLCGVAIVLTSLYAFGDSKSWTPEIAAGLAVGLALFTKQTALLFVYFPVLAALWLGRGKERNLFARLAVIYAITGIFVGVLWLGQPQGPTLETHDAVFHHKEFYVSPDKLLEDPTTMWLKNFDLLQGYVGTYLTWPAALVGLFCLGYLTWRRSLAPWVLLSICIPPLVLQVTILALMFPTRWAFPHMWPVLVMIGLAAADAWKQYGSRLGVVQLRLAMVAAAVVVAGPMLYQAQGMLLSPRDYLHAGDAKNFMGSHAHVGTGNREAIEYFIAEARRGPLILLTDPIWGPPADSMFPYLNHRYGIRVYEAWWMQLSGRHEILPKGPADIMKSQYQRVKAGVIDFSRLSRVFYVTDTFHSPKAEVRIRQPNAKLVQSFSKHDGRHSIDIYRLK